MINKYDLYGIDITYRKKLSDLKTDDLCWFSEEMLHLLEDLRNLSFRKTCAFLLSGKINNSALHVWICNKWSGPAIWTGDLYLKPGTFCCWCFLSRKYARTGWTMNMRSSLLYGSSFYFSLNSFQLLNKMLNGFRPHLPVIPLLENKIFK